VAAERPSMRRVKEVLRQKWELKSEPPQGGRRAEHQLGLRPRR
jgi:hypothetical protein